jgi:hypothetical protein
MASQALLARGKQLQLDKMKKIHRSYVIPGFGYLLFDIFKNNVDFDMGKVKLDIHKDDNKLSKRKNASRHGKFKGVMSPMKIRDMEKRRTRREKEKDDRRSKLNEIKANA